MPETPVGVVEVVDARGGGETATGVVGIVDATELIVGDTPSVGTAAAELTPRLLISVESRGIPTRGAPPGVIGVVGVEEAATLLEPAPHIPDIPAVSMIPEAVDMPELCIIPDVVDIPEVIASEDDALGDAAVLPAAAPVAGIDDATDMPPPS